MPLGSVTYCVAGLAPLNMIALPLRPIGVHIDASESVAGNVRERSVTIVPVPSSNS